MPIAVMEFFGRDHDYRRALRPFLSDRLPRAHRHHFGFRRRLGAVLLMGAPQLAEWMKQHPAERLAEWRCVIGKHDGRGA
jgi:hypothetical protein